LQDAMVFLIEAHFKPVLGYSSEIGHCKVDFHNVYVKLYWISTEIQVILKQEIIKLVRFSTAKGVGNADFSSP